VFGELYSSDLWLWLHDAIQKQPPECNHDGTHCNLVRVVAAIILWSNVMQLANFGTAKLWPAYLMLGNQSGWYCGKPTACKCHHIANFTLLPDSIQDFICQASPNNKNAKGPLLTHLRHELMHGIWDKLLDNEFINGYEHGIPTMCGDGVE
ncbi:hypothetical protein BS47DRAFT_1309176, partial [Hydnum rufescens UP504]